VNLREFLYPLLQAYDSVAMDVDLELGGSDQTFNMLCGRNLMKAMKNKDKFVMTTPLLADSQGRKIGKTEGNVIALNDSPSNLFGKIMSLSDDVVVKGFEYLTDVSMEEIGQIEIKIKAGENPINSKKQLAFEIVKQLNSEDDANKAQEEFERVVQHGEAPSAEIKTKTLKSGATIVDALVELGFSASRSDAKRLVEQGGVSLNDKTVTDPIFKLTSSESLIKAGNRKFGKVTIENGKE
jgi:tyrosyl-tRNA synthetase